MLKVCKACSLNRLFTLADNVVALKSIAAYRSGLDINTNVRKEDAEKGLIDDIKGYLLENDIMIS